MSRLPHFPFLGNIVHIYCSSKLEIETMFCSFERGSLSVTQAGFHLNITQTSLNPPAPTSEVQGLQVGAKPGLLFNFWRQNLI